MMKTVIVTGGTGFVGNALVKKISEEGVHVFVIVRDTSLSTLQDDRKRVLTNNNITLIQGDVTDIKRIEEDITEEVDVYYNLAWVGTRGDALIDYSTQISNIEYMMDSICVASNLGCKKFIGAGSISEYELFAGTQCKAEGDKHSVYKAAKYSCWLMGKELAKTKKIDFIWPVITNIYGPGENSPRLINTLVRNLLNKGEQDLSEGNQIYDFVYLTDAANAFYLIGEKGHGGRDYVIGSGGARPLKEFLEQIPEMIGRDCRLNFGAMKFNGYYLDKELYNIDQLCSDTGYCSQVPFVDGIREVIADCKSKY